MSDKEFEKIDLQNAMSPEQVDEMEEMTTEEMAVDGYYVVWWCLSCYGAHSSSGKGTQMYHHSTQRGTRFESHATTTHKCTRNEGKACKQLIQMHNKAHCYWYWALVSSWGMVLYNLCPQCAKRPQM